MSQDTMNYLLSNEIYIGVLMLSANCTGIVNDTRVVERNADGPHVRVEDFCDPVVDRDLFVCVQQLRELRANAIRKQREPKADADKLIVPQSRGLTLKYLLTGLVRCGCCKSSMRPVPSRRKSKTGREYTYTHYACPRAVAGACNNGRYVREDRLREAVISRLRARLFPPPDAPGRVPDWFPRLVTLVQQELDRYHVAEPDRSAAREVELRQLSDHFAGWAITLGDSKLPAAVRDDIVGQYDRAKAREAVLKTQAEADRAMDHHFRRTLDPKVVLDHLHRLGDILAGYNSTLGNLELSKHIDCIQCFPDDRVEMKGTWLGVLDGASSC